MTNLKPIKSGWKWLEKTLNDFASAINARTVTVPTGGGLDIQETSNGTLIALSSSSTAALARGAGAGAGTTYVTPPTGDLSFIQYAPSGSAAQWLQLNVVVQTGTGYTLSSMYVWGTPPVGYSQDGASII